MATAAQRLAEWTANLAYDEIPPEVLEAAKLHLLDTLGCGLAAHALGVASEGRTAMAELGGDEQASVIGLDLVDEARGRAERAVDEVARRVRLVGDPRRLPPLAQVVQLRAKSTSPAVASTKA